ncbi:MAG: hypothetical protein ACM3Q9_00965 [Methanosarcina sp.]
MAVDAATLNATRTFAGNVVVTWTPSTKTAAVTVLITVNGSSAWEYTFEPDNATAQVKASGDTWALEGGTFTAKFSGDTKSGQLKAHEWSYSVEGEKHHFDGVIGNWS